MRKLLTIADKSVTNLITRPNGMESRVRVVVLNATFNDIQLYPGGQFFLWRTPECPEKTTDMSQVTDKLDHPS
jgi:hypothetical protein